MQHRHLLLYGTLNAKYLVINYKYMYKLYGKSAIQIRTKSVKTNPVRAGC